MKTEYKVDRKAMDAVEETRAGYRADDDEVTFEIRESLGILRKSNTGWTRELNVVCWNGGAPRFDIRDWDPSHAKMGRGITFTKEEAVQICKWLKDFGIGTTLAAERSQGTVKQRSAGKAAQAAGTADEGDGPQGFERVPEAAQDDVPF